MTSIYRRYLRRFMVAGIISVGMYYLLEGLRTIAGTPNIWRTLILMYVVMWAADKVDPET